MILENNSIKIHIDVPSAQTGVSRYGEEYRPQWQYVKNIENYSNNSSFIIFRYSKDENITSFKQFDFLLSHKPNIEGFEIDEIIHGYSGIQISPPTIHFNNNIYILKNNEFNKK